MGAKLRRKGNEGQRVVSRRVDQLVDTEGVTDPGLHHQARVEDQVVGRYDMRGEQFIGKKRGDPAAVGGLDTVSRPLSGESFLARIPHVS